MLLGADATMSRRVMTDAATFCLSLDRFPPPLVTCWRQAAFSISFTASSRRQLVFRVAPRRHAMRHYY